MNRPLEGLALVLLLVSPAAAQDTDPTSQTPSQNNVRFRVDGLFRQEWTKEIFVSADETKDEDRRRFRVLPRLEFGGERFTIGAGGDFNYSTDKNVDVVVAQATPLLRDNYDSRDARLDLAFARVEPVNWLRLEGGRFEMPVGLTEMIWDRDLRPQGAAITLRQKDAAGVSRLGATGLWARGSHVFDDEDVEMILISGQATFTGTVDSSFQLVGSYVAFRHPDKLEPMIRRQNTRVLGQLVNDYKIVDVVARVRQEGGFPVQLVADFCWNTAADEDKKGLWLAAVLGSLKNSLARGEYTYAKVDKDATLAAYATDDFFWSTGWSGHRGEIATRAGGKSTLHVIGQLQKFKDSPIPAERDHWVKRLRVEMRVSY